MQTNSQEGFLFPSKLTETRLVTDPNLVHHALKGLHMGLNIYNGVLMASFAYFTSLECAFI